MNPERWQQINRIYHEALDRKGSQRTAFLDAACGKDAELRTSVEALLASHEQAHGFLESPAVAVAARAIACEGFREPRQAAPARVLLTVSKGPREGKSLIFTGHRVYIFGRANDCYEIMPEDDPTVGRHHFVLEVNPPRVTIRDLGSLNGTYVNRRRLGGGRSETRPGERPNPPQTAELHPGDKIQAGDTVFLVNVEYPVSCVECGRNTGLYLPMSAETAKCAVYCDACGKAHHREGSRLQGPAPGMPSEISYCDVCRRDVTAETGLWRRGEYICRVCQARMTKDKNFMKRVLVTTSRHGGREGKPLIKDFEIQKSLGKGRLGAVYLARRKDDHRQVAIKVVLSEAVADAVSQAEFAIRLETLRKLRHPNLVEMVDYGSASSAFYLVLEYCDAGNIKQLMDRRNGKLGLHEAVPLMQQALEGLTLIHERGLVHGDLKPQNILLTGTEGKWMARISDFGLLRSFQEAGLGGIIAAEDAEGLLFTPRELLAGSSPAGPPSDVWSIAAVFYYVLTGQFPHDAKTDTDLLASLIEPTIIPLRDRSPDIMPELAQLIDESLSLNPNQRPQRAGDFLERLRKLQIKILRLTLAH